MAAKHPFTKIVDAAVEVGDAKEIVNLSEIVLSAFVEADGNLPKACQRLSVLLSKQDKRIPPPSLGTMRKITELLHYRDGTVRDEINARWPDRRGSRAAPGRSPLRIIAQQVGVAEHKIRTLAEKRGISYEAAAEELKT